MGRALPILEGEESQWEEWGKRACSKGRRVSLGETSSPALDWGWGVVKEHLALHTQAPSFVLWRLLVAGLEKTHLRPWWVWAVAVRQEYDSVASYGGSP